MNSIYLFFLSHDLIAERFVSKEVAGGNCKVAEHYLTAISATLWSGGSTPDPSAERNGKFPLEKFENQGALIK